MSPCLEKKVSSREVFLASFFTMGTIGIISMHSPYMLPTLYANNFSIFFGRDFLHICGRASLAVGIVPRFSLGRKERLHGHFPDSDLYPEKRHLPVGYQFLRVVLSLCMQSTRGLHKSCEWYGGHLLLDPWSRWNGEQRAGEYSDQGNDQPVLPDFTVYISYFECVLAW